MYCNTNIKGMYGTIVIYTPIFFTYIHKIGYVAFFEHDIVTEHNGVLLIRACVIALQV